MKILRWILGFMGVFVFLFVMDLVFYNYVFNDVILAQYGLVRAPEELRKLLPVMFLGQFIFSLFFTYYFFRLYKDATLMVLRGLFYGFWMGFFLFGVRFIAEYYLLSLSTKFLVYILILGWVECILAGIGLGLVAWVIPMLMSSLAKEAKAAPAAAPSPVPMAALLTCRSPV